MRPQDASLFDPKAEFNILHRRLPHWDQVGTYAFITFRLIDSLPQQLVRQLARDRARLLCEAGFDPEVVDLQAALSKLSRQDASILRWKLFFGWDAKLDAACGHCWLRDAAVSKIISDGLLKFDGDRYTMAAFVIMPNHVHVLAAFRDEGAITQQGAAWRRFFARQINELIGREDHLWQQDQFDHLVRSEASFDRIRHYIVNNPSKANLRCGEYRLYVSPEI